MDHMMWVRMPGQSWPGAAASFVGMWTLMMVPMMLPVLLPMLWPYRRSVMIAVVAAGYFAVWAVLGAVIFPIGVMAAALVPHQSAAAGAVVVLGGVFQWSRWKARHLECCRSTVRAMSGIWAAWQQGLQLGVHCCCCSLGLTAMLLVLGIMDVRVMMLVATATMVERLVPHGERLARVAGAIAVAAGLILMARPG